MKDLEPLHITDDRKLDKQIAQAFSDVVLLFVDEEHECLIYREGIDDIPGTPYDVLALYSSSLDACADALPPEMHFTITFEAEGLYWCRLWYDGMFYPDEPGWCMDGDTRAEALAGCLLAYAESELAGK